jgi:diguanylate cyclase (GGDEF)-like protein
LVHRRANLAHADQGTTERHRTDSMRKSVGEARRAAGRLFLAYSLASLLPLLALAGALVQDLRREAVAHGLEQGRAQSTVVEEMAIAPALSGADLREGLSMSEREMLQDATDLAVFRGSLVRLRLRDFDGSVVYSDDGTTVDGAAVDSRAFREAARGVLDVTIQPDPVDGTGKVIRSLQPVVATASGRAVGVLELYLPYDEIQAQAERHLRDTYERLAWGLGLLWLVLAVISWSSSRSLRRQALLREHQALHDSLTGLPNRAAFLAAVDRLLAGDRRATVVLLDLDGFKAVNDTHGHAAGDALLTEVAARLRTALQPGEVAARLGGDEFALLLRSAPDATALQVRLDGLVTALSAPLELDGTTIGVGASVGTAHAPAQGQSVDRLMRTADEAMYQCKRTRRGTPAEPVVPAQRTVRSATDQEVSA